jgi:peptidoglycan hydrolase-like protein with peptidoglycan-binding domain
MKTGTSFKVTRTLSVAAIALLAPLAAVAATGGIAPMANKTDMTQSATAKAPEMAAPMAMKQAEKSALPKAKLPWKAEVMGVQNALKAKGYKLAADGILGKRTRAALRKYQKANKLKVTGRIDKATLRSLKIS